MTQAGWYPDPAGTPQTYRYWDGRSWSQETSSDPYAPPPGPPAPPAPPPPPPASPTPPPASPTPPPASPTPPPTVLAGGAIPPSSYGQPPPVGGGYPPSPATGSRGSGLTILLVVVGVLALVGLSVGGFFGYRALTDDDSDTDASDERSATDTPTSEPTDTTEPTETSDSTTTPTESSSAGVETTAQQCEGGRPQPTIEPPEGTRRVSGGGLTIPVPDGYSPDTSYSDQFTWADDFTPVQKVIEQTQQSGWVSIYGVGGLRKSNGFTDPQQAAEVVMSCMAQSTSLYDRFSGRTDLSAGEVTVDGNEAYQVTAELRVDNPDLTVEGDVAQVIVVDMGDAETFGLYLTVVPIGDQALIDQQEAAVGRISAD